ncbi:MAG: hypothetical protein JO368_10250, partial [Acidimicrobiales bacterium]|nr:hypothetical protein [Acidimicrobiales bacterium]
TRLSRLGGEVTAVVVAKAAVDRLGWEPPAGVRLEALAVGFMVPQVAQGALAVECRADDPSVIEVLEAIDDPATRIPVMAERAFLAELGGGCTLPVGAHARWSDGGSSGSAASPAQLCLRGMVAAYDGRVVLRHDVSGADPLAVGREAARYLMEEAGGRELVGVSE